MIKSIKYLLYLATIALFCQCGGSSDSSSATSNDTTSSETAKTNTGEQEASDSQDEGSSSSSDSPQQKIKNIIEAYFALYAQGDWDALAGYYAPEITQFITIKNAKPTQVTASAKSFFKNKTNVRYTPDMSTCKITQAQMGWDAQLELDMEWDQQKTRVLLKLAFLEPGHKIVFYKEEKVLSKQKRGAMSLEELFKSIPLEKRLFVQQGDPVNLSNDPQMLKYAFMSKSHTYEHSIKALNWQNRTILVVVASNQMPTSGTQTSKKFSGGTSIFFLEKTTQGWQDQQLINESTLKEVTTFFAYKDIASIPLAVVRFQGNDFTIAQGNKKMSIAWDNGTYRIVSKEE